jgi:signal transduction histidine kinase
LIVKFATGLKSLFALFVVLVIILSSAPLAALPVTLRDSLINEYERSTDEVYKFSLIKQLSRLSFQSGDYLAAIDYLKLESETYLLKKDSVSWANAHYNLGMVYSILRSFDKATYHSSLALIFFERGRFQREAGNTFINLGYISNELRQTETSIGYYKRAEDIFMSLSSHKDLEASYMNLGVLSDKSKEAELNKKEEPQIQSQAEQSDLVSLIAIRSSLGKILANSNDLVAAENYLLNALRLTDETGDKSYESIIRIALGSVYFKKGKNKEAQAYLEEGLGIAVEQKMSNAMLDAYAELAGVSMKLGKAPQAYAYLNNYIQLKDSLYDEQSRQNLTKTFSQQGVGTRELQSERMLRQNLEQALEIERNNNSKVALIGFALFVVLLLAIIFRKYYSKTKTYDNLEDKNRLIEQQKLELEELITTKDRFLSIIAHDLKNPFTSLLGFADLAYNEFDEISDAEKRSYLNIIRISSQQIYSLLDNLLTWSRAQSGRIDFKPEKVSLSELVENSIDVVRSSAENKQITLFKDFTNEVNVQADKNMLFTVLRNLLTNAVKFTPSGGSVTVSYKRSGSRAIITVSDTGIGMTEDELSRLFKLDGNLRTSGTNNETGTGLGLILCQEFMHLHNSEIEAESIPGEGSRFSFAIEIV